MGSLPQMRPTQLSGSEIRFFLPRTLSELGTCGTTITSDMHFEQEQFQSSGIFGARFGGTTNITPYKYLELE